MKKLLFLLLALAWAAAFTACSKDEIPDPNAPTGLPALSDPNDVGSCMDDEAFLEYCLKEFDTDKDGKISRNEADAVTYMRLGDSHFKSLPGIGYFSNLENFSCTWCATIEAADLSNNRKLNSIVLFNCENLKRVILPNSQVPMKHVQVSCCPSVVSLDIPNKVTTLTKQAFSSCSSWERITLGRATTEIGDEAFYGCSSLRSIQLPGTVSSIGYRAFYKCESLTDIHIPDKITEIANGAFSGCKSLTSIKIPDKVTRIGIYAFSGCSSLTSVTIGKGVTRIEVAAFEACTNLTDIDLPGQITALHDNAFYGCSKLSSVYCRATNPPQLGFGVFSETSNLKIYVPAASVEAYKAAEGWSEYASQIVGYKK